jgi:hypothetical protein
VADGAGFNNVMTGLVSYRRCLNISSEKMTIDVVHLLGGVAMMSILLMIAFSMVSLCYPIELCHL